MAETDDGPETVRDAARDPRREQRERSEIEGYSLGEQIGSGGMGEVILAVDESVGRPVAIKRMLAANAKADEVARFLREARIQALLEHPAIVPVHAVGIDRAGKPFFTMKRVTGTTLADVLARGSESTQRLLRAFVDVCLAIELAHTRKVVHRDLKPANIMLGDFGEVYILDWGVARVLDDDGELAPRDSGRGLPLDAQLTHAGSVVGTPAYMAPEQARGEAIGPAADVWALGAILFEILTGDRLRAGPLDSLADAVARSPAQRRADRAVAPELDEACRAALADDPAQRPSARELADRVQAYLDGDRDLETRRTFARTLVTAAQEARAADRRDEAIRLAGRALAIDVESREAATLVTEMILTPPPPDKLPPELTHSLQMSERQVNRIRSRTGMFAVLFTLIVLPFAPFVQISSWPILGVLIAIVIALAGLQWLNARTNAVSTWIIMAVNLVFIVVLSRLCGTLLITPIVICGFALALASRAELSRRPWIAVAWAFTAQLLPMALEYAGVLTSTFRMTDAGLTSLGSIVTSRGTIELVFLLVTHFTALALVAVYAAMLTRGRAEAQRATQIQEWHLRQLLPR
jgi:eukaryotic-like serine/threonine-protein kinase